MGPHKDKKTLMMVAIEPTTFGLDHRCICGEIWFFSLLLEVFICLSLKTNISKFQFNLDAEPPWKPLPGDWSFLQKYLKLVYTKTEDSIDGTLWLARAFGIDIAP